MEDVDETEEVQTLEPKSYTIVGKEALLQLLRDQHNMQPKQAKNVYSSIMNFIKDTVDSGGIFKLAGIGTLRKIQLNATTAKDPRTGLPIDVPPRTKYALRSKPKAD